MSTGKAEEKKLFDFSSMSRAEDGTVVSRSVYNLMIGLIIFYGLLINVAECYFLKDFFAKMNMWVFLIGYLVLAIGGIVMIHKAKSPAISFIGYNLLVLPVGGVVSVCVGATNQVAVLQAFLTTTIVVAFMTLMGTLWTNFFLKIGVVLGVCLGVLIVAELLTMLITGSMPIIYSWIGAGIFTLFIGYDWSRAQISPPTKKNAVMNAASLYLDIVNLFLDLLRIFNDR